MKKVLTLRKKCVVASLLVILVSLLPANLESSRKRVPIQRDDVVGTWVGLTTDELEMIRLTLGPRGDGKLGFSFMDEEPCVVGRISWIFDRGKVELNLDKSSGECQRDREFRAVATGTILQLTIQGHGWRRRASLRKEESIVERWKSLRAAMSTEN